MKKLIAVIVVGCFFLVGCNSDVKNIEGNKTNTVKVYVDPETGVNYLVYTEGHGGGITVRYTSNGEIMVTKVGDEK